MPTSSIVPSAPEAFWCRAGWLLSTALLGTNLYFHDMWFDELQAWGLVCTSRNLIELIGLIEPEGHPPLWYLILYPLTRLSEDPRWMQLLAFCIGTTSFGLIWFKAPFRVLDRLLLCLSFQVGYLFSVFSRCYSLGTLLVFVFLSDLPSERSKAWRGWLVLALLVNVHFYFFLTACGLALVWMRCSENRRELLHGSGIFFLGNTVNAFCLTRILYTTTHEVSGFMLTILCPIVLHSIVLLSADFFSPRLKFESAFRPLVAVAVVGMTIVALSSSGAPRMIRDLPVLAAGFLPLCNPFGGSYWNFHTPLGIGLLVMLVVIACLYRCLADFPLARWLLLVQAVCLLAVSATSHSAKLWHSGVLFLSFLSMLWVAMRASKVSAPGWLLTTLLVGQALTGVQAMALSKWVPVSAIKQTADWLNENAGEDHLLVGIELFPVSAVSNYLDGRDLYYPHREQTLKYCPWGEWFLSLQPPRIRRELQKRQLRKAYLVASLPKLEMMQERFAPYADLLELSEVAVLNKASSETFVIFEITLLR